MLAMLLQVPLSITNPQTVSPGVINIGPVDPVCPKYEYWMPAHLNGDEKQSPGRCVEEIHFITEREWQALMLRIEALEKKAAQPTGGTK